MGSRAIIASTSYRRIPRPPPRPGEGGAGGVVAAIDRGDGPPVGVERFLAWVPLGVPIVMEGVGGLRRGGRGIGHGRNGLDCFLEAGREPLLVVVVGADQSEELVADLVRRFVQMHGLRVRRG